MDIVTHTSSSPDVYPTRTRAAKPVAERLDPVVYADQPQSLAIAEETLARYESRGFMLIERLFAADEVEILRHELDRLRADDRLPNEDFVILEPESRALRSIFEVHRVSPLFLRLARDARLVHLARRILGSDVYLHQTRVNYKPGFFGKEFYWHSDFETWHAEDGLPRMRTVSMSIGLSDNSEVNGPLMLVPGSHLAYVPCAGETPDDHYLQSLRRQEVGVPEPARLQELIERGGIETATGPAGTTVVFDCNTMHGSNSNISPYPRANVFLVYNSVLNIPSAPYAARRPRPGFLAEQRDFAPLEAVNGRIGE